MYPPTSYVSPSDFAFLASLLIALCLVLAYALRQVRLRAVADTGAVQRWRDRAERAESEARRLRAGQRQAIAENTAAMRQQLKSAKERNDELVSLLTTWQSHAQRLAGENQRLTTDLWNARHDRSADVRRLLELQLVPHPKEHSHAS